MTTNDQVTKSKNTWVKEGAKIQINDMDDLFSEFISAISPNLENYMNIVVCETFRTTDRT